MASAPLLLLLPLLDCASPGPPRPPSLQLPEPVRDLSAARVGNRVELRFTVPQHSTDKLPLRTGAALGSVCRSEGSGPCVSFPGAPTFQSFSLEDAGNPRSVGLADPLEGRLLSGAPRLLTYRVEFFNASRHSAGLSEPAFAAAGEAPPPVAGLKAEGSRQGVLLAWQAASYPFTAEVLLRREQLATPSQPQTARASAQGTTPKPGLETVWLQTNSGAPPAAANQTLDSSAHPGETYGYAAQRRRVLQIAGHSLEVRGELSAPVLLTLSDSFPPPAPSGLTAAGFGDRNHYAVDLIWEPVSEPASEGTEGRAVMGYLVRRVPLDANGGFSGEPTTLTPTPVAAPAFHDTTANPALSYRYEVTAVDGKGNQSPAVTVTVEPSAGP